MRNAIKASINPSQNGQTTNQVRRHVSYYQYSFVSVDRTICNLPNILPRLAVLFYVSPQTERIDSTAFKL